MEDEDTGEEITCPFCNKSENCSHLLATIDRTFGEWVGGYAYDRQSELSNLIDSNFKAKLLAIAQANSWGEYALDELWSDAFQDPPLEDIEVHLETRPLFDLISELFDEADAIELQGVFEGGPGASSSLSSFYAKNPKSAFNGAIKALKKRLKG